MIRAIIVDDEELARRGIRKRLTRYSDIQVVAECANAREAAEAISRELPDLLFLDVQMPGRLGTELLSDLQLKRLPHVVFVTAHDHYAVKAFELHALDYLLKPIDDERFASALQRVRETIHNRSSFELSRKVVNVLQTLHNIGSSDTDRLVIRLGGRVVFARYTEIDWVEATGDYVTIHCGTKDWLMRETISAMEQQLKDRGFARIHRSAIVRLHAVSEMRSLDNGEYAVFLKNGVELRLSRTYREVLPQLLGKSAQQLSVVRP
jgi:two-component system, LytTR family, response regulator